MVTRSKKGTTGRKNQTKGRVKVGKLNINKETVKDLTVTEQKQLRGGAATSRRLCTGGYSTVGGSAWRPDGDIT